MTIIFTLLILGYSHIRIQNLHRRQELRNQISADLHDDIGSSLSSIRFMAEMLTHERSISDKIGQKLETMKEQISRISQNLDEIMWYIKPTSDSIEEIHLKLRPFASELLETKGVELLWIQTEDFNRAKLSSHQKRDYFLTIKEIINNVAKHSKASQVKVDIGSEGKHFRLQIQDNGIGFDPDQPSISNGMQTIRSRTKRLRGQLDIQSTPGVGTHVMLRFPFG